MPIWFQILFAIIGATGVLNPIGTAISKEVVEIVYAPSAPPAPEQPKPKHDEETPADIQRRSLGQ